MVAVATVLTFAMLFQAPAQADVKPLIIRASKHDGGNAEAVAISADGALIAAGFGGPSNGRFPLKPNGGGICVWERKSGKVVVALGEYGDIIKIGFSRDGRFLAYARIYTPGDSIEDNTTVLIELRSKEIVKRWRSAAFALSPVDDLMVVSGQRTEIVNLKTLQVERTVDVRNSRAYAFSADGKTIAALCHYWANRKGPPHGLAFFSAHRDEQPFILQDESLRSANTLAAAPDGTSVVTGHVGGRARIWSTAQRQEIRSLQVDTELCLFPLFTGTGKTLALATQPANGVSWSYDRTQPGGFKFAKDKTPPYAEVHFFDLHSGKLQRVWRFEDASFRTVHARFGSARHHPEYNPARFALSTDGKTLVAGCNGCCTVDVETGRVLGLFARSSGKE